MTSISDKAREYADRMENGPYVHLKDTRDLLRELADENERLRKALHFYADFYEWPDDGPWGINSDDFGDIARHALKGGA